MKSYGTRATYRILGVSAFVVAILYFFFNIFYIRRRRLNAEKSEKVTPEEKTTVGKPNDVCGEQGGLGNPVFVPDDDAAKSASKGKSIN